jgi:hypothetical protein
LFLEFTKTTDGTTDGSSGDSARGQLLFLISQYWIFDIPDSPSSTSQASSAAAAFPDTDRLSLDRVLTAESASVLAVLGDFNLLDLLTEGRTVTGTVLSDNSGFLGTLGLKNG